MNPRYFFACSYPLLPGSVVLPGNWGRILEMYQFRNPGFEFGNPWIFYREDIFERIRKKEFPDKPSRLKSIFICESAISLTNFIQETKRFMDLSYQVSLLDSRQPIHRGCLSLLDLRQAKGLDVFMQNARNYWVGEKVLKPELLTTSPLKIEFQCNGI